MISFAACFHSLKGGEVILMATWVNKVGLRVLTRSMRAINLLCNALVSKHTDRREEQKRAYQVYAYLRLCKPSPVLCVVVNMQGLIHIGGVITPVSSCLQLPASFKNMGRTDFPNPGYKVHLKKGYNNSKHFPWGFELCTVTFAPDLQQKTRPLVTLVLTCYS